MKRIISLVSCFCLASLFLSSCIVSKKKFDAETARANKEHDNAVALNSRLAQMTDQNNKLNGNIKDLNNNVKDLNALNVALNRDRKSVV